MWQAITHGFILAFGLILPLGVQNVFIFNQGAQRGWLRSLPVILTASLCDTLLISLAVVGVSAVVLEFAIIRLILTWGGFLFLIYMGWLTWKSTPQQTENSNEQWTAKRQIMFALSVSLLNPHAILDTIGVIGTSSLAYSQLPAKIAFTLTCIGVSWIWFLSLAYAGKLVGQLGNSDAFIVLLNKVSAVIMWGSAIYLVSQL
ncbi:LysE/ArgO family amino acid transporter [Brevibacillus sp. SYSU BS000544]|uniref:LysE/ArgO family amino acid transporter n=1 Tax=Brevibacillus sp. SYSU BS000544 TaxID=3416443 RepID=UPI003CE59CDD